MAILKVETVGKRFKKRQTVKFSDDVEGIKQMSEMTESFHTYLTNLIIRAKKNLTEKGFDTEQSPPLFRGRYFKGSITDPSNLNELYRKGLVIEEDSEESEWVAIWQAAEIALNENNKIETRLEFAFRAGDLLRRIIVYRDYGPSQKKVAVQERQKGLTTIFDKLKLRKKTGETPKQLWQEFISILQAECQIFDGVQELKSNAANCKTWSVQFSIIPDNDNRKFKEQTMKYDRFVRRLNEK